MLGMAYLVYHTCYTLCMLYVSRGVARLRKKALLNDLYGEDNATMSRCASTPPYKDWIYWFIKTCAIFAVLTDNLMLTNSFTNNLYDLPNRPHTSDIDVAYAIS